MMIKITWVCYFLLIISCYFFEWILGWIWFILTFNYLFIIAGEGWIFFVFLIVLGETIIFCFLTLLLSLDLASGGAITVSLRKYFILSISHTMPVFFRSFYSRVRSFLKGCFFPKNIVFLYLWRVVVVFSLLFKVNSDCYWVVWSVFVFILRIYAIFTLFF